MQFIWIIGILLQGWLWASEAPWLGFTFIQRGASPCSLQVESVHPKSGALQAGLQKGDVVVQLDGHAIRALADIKAKISQSKVGQVLSLDALRMGKVMHLQVKLSARPDDLRQFTGGAVGSKSSIPNENLFYANKDQRKKAPKAILIDFWATWCGPCRASIPILREIYGEFSSQGLDLIGMSSEELSALQKFQQMEREPWPLYEDRGSQQAGYWGVRAIPTLLLLDRNWVVQKVWQGIPPKEEVRAQVKILLGK